MTTTRHESIFTQGKSLRFQVESDGEAHVLITGPGKPDAGFRLSRASAIEVRDQLIESLGLPDPVTFQSQFEALAIGDEFAIYDGPNDPTPWRGIKISGGSYFNKRLKMVRDAETTPERWSIKKA